MKMKSFTKLRSIRGFSLMELAVAAVINTMVGIGAYKVITASAHMQLDLAGNDRVNGEARILGEHLVSDIRGAIALENTFTDSGKTYTYSTSTLILKVPSIDSNADPSDISSKFDRIIYHPGDHDYFIHRTIVPGQGSSRVRETRLLGKSENGRIAFRGSFLAQPDALGSFVVNYEFESLRKNYRKHTSNGDYSKAIAGSVYLRNRK
jgi:hypothetical protein